MCCLHLSNKYWFSVLLITFQRIVKCNEQNKYNCIFIYKLLLLFCRLYYLKLAITILIKKI